MLFLKTRILECLPSLLIPACFHFPDVLKVEPNTVHLLLLCRLDIQRYISQKSKVFRVAKCSVSILPPDLVSTTLKQHSFLPFSVWKLFSLTEKRGNVDTEIFCFFYVIGFQLQNYLCLNLLPLNLPKMPLLFPSIIHMVPSKSRLIFS